MLCKLLGHKYIIVEQLSSSAKKIGCSECDKKWAMHAPTKSFLEWDEELAALYAPGGLLSQPHESEV